MKTIFKNGSILLFMAVTLFSLTTNAQVPLSSLNLFAATNNGSKVEGLAVGNSISTSGNLLSTAMTTLFQPFDINGSKTAAIGQDAAGNFYFLPNERNNGSVDLYAVNALLGNRSKVASIDLNGVSGSSLGFVRLGIDANGYGWILAGDGSSLYLAKFQANGTAPTTIEVVNTHVQIAGGGDVSLFQNGDLCFDGHNKMYALANDGSGRTNIYTMSPYTNSNILTLRFTLLNQDGRAFTGQVNGVAFDQPGSLYISTLSGGLYFIDQHTVNYSPVPATVTTRYLVQMTGLTDLASNAFPMETTLPIKLLSFSAETSYSDVVLNWETASEENAFSFEIEKSTDGVSFSRIGTVPTKGAGSYSFTDRSAIGSNYYRLKMIDLDAQFQYSATVFAKTMSSETKMAAFPNPFSSNLQFTVKTNTLEVVSYQLFSSNGLAVKSQRLPAASGTRSYSVDGLSQLPRGVYLLKINSGAETQTFQLIKQ